MCTEQTGASWDRPINQGDVAIIKQRHACLNPQVIDDIYFAITNNAAPKAAVFVALVTLAHRVDHEKWSHNMEGVALMPFSAMRTDNGERYQTKGMIPFHDALLAFCLGMRNVALLQEVLARHNMRFISYHDCGCGITKDDAGFERSEFYLALNHWRSWGEGVGKKVHHVDFDSIRRLPTDMCEIEIHSYNRMWELLQVLPRTSLEIPLNVLLALEVVKKVVSKQSQFALAA